MRVIAGKARRLPLKTLPGLETRPTTDRTKETLFNILQPYLCDCRFLDLCSGSGAIGIEALSRGAAAAVFVEKNPKAVECIGGNLRFTKLQEDATVLKADAISALCMLEGEEPFDCIFMDPPYGKEIEKKIRAEVFPGQVLKQKEEGVSAEKGKKTSKKSADSETNADLQNGLF